MKYFILLSTLLFLAINIVAGYLLTSYDTPKVVSSSTVLVLNAVFLMVIQSAKLKNAFRVSLNFLFPVIGIIEFCLCFFVPANWTDNYAAIALFVMLAFQILIIAAVKINSKV